MASVTDGDSGVAGGEYFVGGTDPGVGNGAAMSWDGSNLTATFGTNLQPGVYEVTVRAQDNAGNWSETITDYLVIFDPAGPTDVVGRRSIVPSLGNGDVLPGLNTVGQNDKLIFGFDAKFGQAGGIDASSAFSFTYDTGSKCNSQNPINCHTTSFVHTSFNFLSLSGVNSSIGTFRGVGTVVVDGVATQVIFTVVAKDGDLLVPVEDDTIIIKLFNMGDDPATATPLYQVSGSLSHGSSVKIQ